MDVNDIRNYLLAGKATGTLTSNATGNRITYRVVAAKGKAGASFVSYLNGPDNVADYAYLGMLFNDDGRLAFRLTKGSKLAAEAPAVRGFRWLVDCINSDTNLGERGEFTHDGVCGRCGRALTVPESVRSGLGPECAKRVAE